MYRHIFGPVPSRRLGMSLGIDLVPHKVCSLNCVYCECGRTTTLTLERREYVPCEAVTREIAHYLAHNPRPDYITFSGSGEPTLNARIGDVLHFIRRRSRDIPVAVLTNGTLFFDPDVRRELLAADVVLPSLDAAVEETFRKINRPFHTLKLSEYIQGLVDFRRQYSGKMWLEVLMIPGINDNPEDIAALGDAFAKIRPDEVQLNTLDRPGAVQNLRAATLEELQDIAAALNYPGVRIIAAAAQRKKTVAYRGDTESAILETVRRRPCTLQDLHEILGLHVNEINKYLDVLENDGRVTTSREDRGLFYRIAR